MHKVLFYLCLVSTLLMSVNGEPQCFPKPGTPTNTPLGECRGIYPGRVIWAHRPDACHWDGKNGFWWNSSNIDSKIVEKMLDATIRGISGQQSAWSGWARLFDDVNTKVYKTPGRGYKNGDGVAIKINLNGLFGSYENNNANGLSPQFLMAVLRSLILEYGIPEKDIAVYDSSRWFVNYMWDAVRSTFGSVRCVDNLGKYGRESAVVDQNSHLQFSNTTVPAWNETWLPTVETEARFMIVIDNFRGHSYAGVTLSGKNWFGSIWRPDCTCLDAGHWCPMSLHSFINVHDVDGLPGNPMGSYTPLVDLLGHPDKGGKAVIFLMDGLYGGFSQEADPPVRFQSYPFNGEWSCSLFASQDPVALDSVAFDFLRNEPNVPLASGGCVDNYLHEAALLPNPPSGTVYNPTGKAPLSKPLGCHEHWDSAMTKRYSRNLGTGNGIELKQVSI